jgi:hypothetical protein
MDCSVWRWHGVADGSQRVSAGCRVGPPDSRLLMLRPSISDSGIGALDVGPAHFHHDILPADGGIRAPSDPKASRPYTARKRGKISFSGLRGYRPNDSGTAVGRQS